MHMRVQSGLQKTISDKDAFDEFGSILIGQNMFS